MAWVRVVAVKPLETNGWYDVIYAMKETPGTYLWEIIGEDYKVIKFETGGFTYLPIEEQQTAAISPPASSIVVDKAQEEIETALLTPEPEPETDDQEINVTPLLSLSSMNTLLNQKNTRDYIENIIRQYYNGLRINKILKVEDESSGVAEMWIIHDLKVLSVSENVANIAVRFRWRFTDLSLDRNDRGVAAIEKIGSSYRVIKFD